MCPHSPGCAVSCALFRDARPGDPSVCVYCRRGRPSAVHRSSTRAPASRLLLLIASWRAVGHDASVDPLSVRVLLLSTCGGPSGCYSSEKMCAWSPLPCGCYAPLSVHSGSGNVCVCVSVCVCVCVCVCVWVCGCVCEIGRAHV